MREWEQASGTADADGLSVADLSVPGRFEEYAQQMRDGRLPWQRTYAGSWVRCFWWLDDAGEFIGRISIRPDLTPGVRDANHIGYAVRPGRRCEGHATAMLAAALPIAWNLGIDPVVLVCAETNAGSRTVIERNGGVLTEVGRGRCRYLAPRPDSFVPHPNSESDLTPHRFRPGLCAGHPAVQRRWPQRPLYAP
ncbi:GNAT family N-acetyltransferase [Actinomadura harenae]|uniref:GNAT family N-acetyltransferase n=2 Tax=Actinomadura harenae TaxID=2483351 RepID=A0A3M2LR73_9ACTN|nr:GNAT family N-acetyltransferase [Actinomadura harenae]